MTYTQGEWKQKGLSIEVDNRGIICKVLTPPNGGTFDVSANARLIAAAPLQHDTLVYLDTTIMPGERKYDEWGYCRIHRDILEDFDRRVKAAIRAAKDNEESQ